MTTTVSRRADPPNAAARLEALAQSDPAVAPLARLHVLALREAAHPSWAEGVPALARGRLADGLPLLHGQALGVDPSHVQRYARDLAACVATSSSGTGGALIGALDSGMLEPGTLLAAAVRQDTKRSRRAGASASVDPDLLAVLGQLLALPLLRAVGRAAAPMVAESPWDAGYCPVCAAWPLLAERRGLERKRVLRCGRCGAGWSHGLQKCPYCANADYKSLGYLAPEAQREARQAATCDACMGYLKAVTTVSAIAADDLALHDLSTLELDLAALDQGYARPEDAGFPLNVVIAPRQPAAKRGSVLPWRQ